MTETLCRTFQTAPAAIAREDSAKFLTSGLTAEGFEAPDWLVPDLEDGTAPEMKAEGLQNLIEVAPEHAPEFPGEIHPRVQWAYDIDAARERGREEIDRIVGEIGDHVDGVVIPKVGRLADVENAIAAVADAEQAHDRPEGSIDVSLIIETAPAKSDLREIAALGADGRLSGLVFGPVDYTAELGGRALDGDRPVWPGLLEDLSNEASANDLVAIGGPFDQLYDERAGITYYNAPEYADQVEREAAVGLDGSWSLHPKQTTQANRIHMPTPQELAEDVHKIERFNEAKAGGTGAVTVDGQMIDEATYKNFANTVDTVRTIHEHHPEQTGTMYDEELLDRALELDTSW
jgi:beta-methylmalyl-CoA/(S)-malyl-CoA lyase